MLLEALMYIQSLNIDLSERKYNQVYNKPAVEVPFYYWGGGQMIDPDKLRGNIRAVLSHLSFVPNDENIVEFVYEVITVESKRGFWVKQRKGPARGIIQMEPFTDKDLMEWLKRRPKAYKEVMAFYDHSQTEEFNNKHNAPYNIAKCICHGYRYSGSLFTKVTASQLHRAFFWKKKYNTKLGKGSVAGYISKVYLWGEDK